jgi:hypothetical protein
LDQLDLRDHETLVILLDAWNAGSDVAQDALRKWVGWVADDVSFGDLILERIHNANREMDREIIGLNKAIELKTAR